MSCPDPILKSAMEEFSTYVRVGCSYHLSDPDLVAEAAQRVWVDFWQQYDPERAKPKSFLAVLITARSVDVWRENSAEIPFSRMDFNSDLVEETGPEDILEILCPDTIPSAEEEFLGQEDEIRFLKMAEEVLSFISSEGPRTREAVESLLVEGRRLSSGGGHIGQGAPPGLSGADRAALTRLRRKLRKAFRYWKDSWETKCDIRSISAIPN